MSHEKINNNTLIKEQNLGNFEEKRLDFIKSNKKKSDHIWLKTVNIINDFTDYGLLLCYPKQL